MAYRACTSCGINYPTPDEFRQCLACGEPTEYSQWGHAEPNWRSRAEAIALRLSKIAAEKLYQPPHVFVPITTDEDGLQYIDSRDCIREGVSQRLDEALGHVVAIGPADEFPEDCPDNNLYEVIAYVDERRSYWVRPLRVPDFP
jgi:hypothetical protein